MKAHGADFDHDHPAWTTHHLHNDEDVDERKPGSAKYETFNNMKVKKLMFVDAESGRKTVVRVPVEKSMLELFQHETPTYLEHEDGCETFIELVTGDAKRGKDKVVGPAWRINGSSTGHKFKNRIGDFYNDNDWGHIGTDKNGHPTSAETAGFGIKDEEWPHHEFG